MTNLKIVVLFAALSLLLEQNGVTAPSISSVSVSGGAISIIGADFGNKPSGTPKAYYNFDSGSESSLVVEPGLSNYQNKYTYVNSDIGGKGAYTRITAGGIGNPLYYDSGSPQTKVYYSAWVKLNPLLAEADCSQLKFFVIANAPTAEFATAEYVSYPWFCDNGSDYRWTQFCRDIVKCGNDYSTSGYHDFTPLPENDTWLRVEWMLKTNSALNAADGTVIDRWIDPHHGKNHLVWSNSTVVTHKTGDAQGWRYVTHKMDIENTALGAAIMDFTIDDMYVEVGGWWHVEVSNSPVWGEETLRFIQPTLTWSDNGITGTFNQGSFKVGDTVYFFVIDENGVPSDGYPVTIGGETPPEPPAPSSITNTSVSHGVLRH